MVERLIDIHDTDAECAFISKWAQDHQEEYANGIIPAVYFTKKVPLSSIIPKTNQDTKMEEQEKLYTEAEAADILRVSPKTLQKRRFDKRPPVYVNLNGTIRYRASDIQKYIEECVVNPETTA